MHERETTAENASQVSDYAVMLADPLGHSLEHDRSVQAGPVRPASKPKTKIQPKLTVDGLSSAHELEADRVATGVVGMAVPALDDDHDGDGVFALAKVQEKHGIQIEYVANGGTYRRFTPQTLNSP